MTVLQRRPSTLRPAHVYVGHVVSPSRSHTCALSGPILHRSSACGAGRLEGVHRARSATFRSPRAIPLVPQRENHRFTRHSTSSSSAHVLVSTDDNEATQAFLDSEYVVYRTNQQRLAYLLECELEQLPDEPEEEALQVPVVEVGDDVVQQTEEEQAAGEEEEEEVYEEDEQEDAQVHALSGLIECTEIYSNSIMVV